LQENSSIQRLTLSENYLEDADIKKMSESFRTKTKIKFLDIADNPFSEQGAESVLQLVQECPSIESIRFENHFLTYKCQEAIRTFARFNYAERRLLHQTGNVPLSVFPTIFSNVQTRCGDRYQTEGERRNMLFWLLRSPLGKAALPLNFQVAAHSM